MGYNTNVTIYSTNKEKIKELRNVYNDHGRSLWDFEDIAEQDGETSTISIYVKFYSSFGETQQIYNILETMDESEYTMTLEGDDDYDVEIVGGLYPNSYFNFEFGGELFESYLHPEFGSLSKQSQQTFIVPMANLNNLSLIKDQFKTSGILLERIIKFRDTFFYIAKTQNMISDIKDAVILKMDDDAELCREVNYEHFNRALSDLYDAIHINRYFVEV